MVNPLVSIIIVNWNGKHFLHDCLSSVADQDYKNIEIIFVDNASTDGSLEYVKSNYPKIIIIENASNLGFAQANNIGYKKCKGEYILFLNNDTKVKKNFLTKLVAGIEGKPDIAGAQSKILHMNNPSLLDSVGAFLTSSGFLLHYGFCKKDSPKYNKIIDIYTAKGASMLFKKSVLDKVRIGSEVFDSRYFAYFEETDLCHRVWLAGYRIIFLPDSVIFHNVGGTSKKIDNTFIQYHSFKNRINSYVKNLGGYQLAAILPLHIVLIELFALYSLIQIKLGLFFALQKSIIWNVITIDETLKKRNIIQKRIRKRTDKEVMPKIKRSVKITYYYYLLFGINNYED